MSRHMHPKLLGATAPRLCRAPAYDLRGNTLASGVRFYNQILHLGRKCFVFSLVFCKHFQKVLPASITVLLDLRHANHTILAGGNRGERSIGGQRRVKPPHLLWQLLSTTALSYPSLEATKPSSSVRTSHMNPSPKSGFTSLSA